MLTESIKPAFIIAEYNPFHNGHKYQIEKTRENGATHIIAVMSGNFVQRGDISICEKHIRARAALLGGADLVLELPLKYAVSNASYFAKGAISVIRKTGLTDGMLSFGAKSSVEELIAVAQLSEEKSAREQIEKISRENGLSYPSAMSSFIKENYGDKLSDVLSDANNTLAIEYIKEAKKQNLEFGFSAVERLGTSHDSLEKTDNIASAMSIRNELYKEYNSKKEQYNLYNLEKYIPESALDVYYQAIKSFDMPVSKEKFELMALARLYSFDADYFSGINNVSHGLENKILKALQEKCTMAEIYDAIKSKRYTHARVRQIILNAVLGISRDFLEQDIGYVRILGHNEKGREILRLIKEKQSVDFISNLSEVNTNNKLSADALQVDILAGRLFELCKPVPKKANSDFSTKPIIIK